MLAAVNRRLEVGHERGELVDMGCLVQLSLVGGAWTESMGDVVHPLPYFSLRDLLHRGEPDRDSDDVVAEGKHPLKNAGDPLLDPTCVARLRGHAFSVETAPSSNH